MNLITCINCGDEVIGNIYCKDQKYCTAPDCQKARKANWKKQRMKTDENFKKKQYESSIKWRKENSDYWKKYRKKNPDKALINRELQNIRNKKPTNPEIQQETVTTKKIAKVDALKTPFSLYLSDFYWLQKIAKVDALKAYPVDIIKALKSKKYIVLLQK